MRYRLYISGYNEHVRDFDSEEEAGRYVAFQYIGEEILLEEAGIVIEEPCFYLIRPDGTKILYVSDDSINYSYHDEIVEQASIDPWREELTPLVRVDIANRYPQQNQ